MSLPEPVAAIAADLAALPGVEAVTLAGSRGAGTARPGSDWDLGLYYRGRFEAGAIAALGRPGTVAPPGAWGPVMNGGAWLTVEGLPVDVLLRDLDVVERWTAEAEAGRFEVLLQTGSLAGAPTYAVAGELALAQALAGTLPRPGFPPPLAAAAPPRWAGRAAAALLFAGRHAGAGDGVACAGFLAEAALAAAHGRLAGRSEWVLTETGLLARAGFDVLPGLTAGRDLPASVEATAAALGIAPLAPR